MGYFCIYKRIICTYVTRKLRYLETLQFSEFRAIFTDVFVRPREVIKGIALSRCRLYNLRLSICAYGCSTFVCA